MKQRALTCLMLGGAAGAQGSTLCRAATSDAAPFGLTIPLADTGRVYASVLSTDEREFYFFRKVGARRSEDYRIYRAARAGAGWGFIERVYLSGEFSDPYPSLSADGNRLVFSSCTEDYSPFWKVPVSTLTAGTPQGQKEKLP